MADTATEDGLCRKSLREVERRAMPGTAGYLIAWLVLMLSDERLRNDLVVSVGMTAVVAALALARIWFSRRFELLLQADVRRTRRVLHVLVLSNAALASLVGVWSVHWPVFEGTRELALVTGGVVCAVGAMALAMDPVLRHGIPAIILGPYAVALGIESGSGDLALLVLIAIFAVYLHRAASLNATDWWAAARLSADQERRARELTRLSITDGLTGLANRVTFDERLGAAWAQAERSGSILSVLLVDLDHFKAINDTFGHATGDRCLIAAAEAIRDCAQRRSDLVARHGGEEFSVLLPETARPAALALGEQVRAAVEGVRVEYEDELIPLSASVGVATMAPNRTGMTAMQLVDAADDALYSAKRAGRNRVEAAAVPT